MVQVQKNMPAYVIIYLNSMDFYETKLIDALVWAAFKLEVPSVS